MKVYEIYPDADRFQELSFDDKNYDLNQLKFFKGSKNGMWIQPKNWYIPNLLAGKSDFISVDGTGEFAIRKETADLLRSHFPPSTEEIKLTYKEVGLYLVNITYLSECLDYDESEYATINDDPKDLSSAYRVEKYVFDKNKFSEYSIFRLKAGKILSVSTYCYEGVKPNPEEEFKYFVEKHKLTGLRFKCVWDSEKE